MEFEMEPYIVYVKTDENNLITAVNSSAFLSDTDGWTEIDRGYTQRYHHAQGNYFPDTIMDERGIYRYLHTPDAEPYWRERTQEEMDADYVEPTPTPSDSERITALEDTMTALIGGIMDAQ